MKKKKRKCIAWPKSSLHCDGCKKMGGRCPYRDKYRDLRNTKYGNDKYGAVDRKKGSYKDFPEILVIPKNTARNEGGDIQMEVDEYLAGHEARQLNGHGNVAMRTYLMHWPTEWEAHSGLDYKWPIYTR